MKNSFNYILILGLVGIIGCNNDNKTIIKKEVKVIKTVDSNGVNKTDSIITENTNLEDKITKTVNKIEKHEYVYHAFDGTEANITFTNNTKEGSFILIERNKLKIELPQIKKMEKGAVYEKDGIKAETNEGKLTITQNGIIFELERK